MTSRIKKATEYADRGKETMIPEEEDPLVETDLSSNNEKRWPEGSPSEKALRGRRIIIQIREGPRGNWSESPSAVRQPYGERIGRETVWKALHQISHSPFSKEIESARLPRNFSAPTYVMYDGKADPVGHISHYRQSMAIHLGNNALMCRMFPSSLGPMSLRWFNRLPHSSIFSWNELAEAFVSRFITNSRKPKEFASLMSMRMKDSESLKNYSARYWEVYNEVDGGTEDMAMKTFKEGLHPESELRHSLSKRSARNMRDLMSRIEQYVRVEEDRARTGALSAQNRPQRRPNNTEQKRAEIPPRNPTRFPRPKEAVGIFFSDEDLRDVQTPHDDPLVIKLRIGDSDVKRVLVDQGSCSEIMYPDLFHGLGLKQTDLQPYDAPLVGFSGESVRPMGRITLNVHTGPISLETEFVVIDVPSPYTAIMGRRWLHRLKAVPSSFHQKLRFPTDFGIMEIKGDQVASKQCIMAALEKARDTHTETYSSCEELDTVIFSSDPEKYFKIGRELSPGNRTELIDFLVGNVDVFAWDPYEVPGVDPNYIEHRLNTDPHSKPVQQKARRSAPVHAEAVQKEVEKLLQAGAIREIQYPTWLSNTVVVKEEKREVESMCRLHQPQPSMPKGPLPLTQDRSVAEDREKTAFITPLGIYCYKVMPFGLKNAGATYQRMVTKMFKDQIGKTMEIYIDDMVVKSRLSQDHLKDLTETFRKSTTFKWDDKCVSAFEDLKRYLSSSLLLSNPTPGEPLFLYLAVSDRAVSAVLIRIKDTVQCPVYYASKTMTEAETHYPPLEKVGLALITAADKLPQYFQAHTVYLVTQYPVQAMFNKADFTGRIWKWGAKISALGVKYLPRTAIKGQVLADFVAEFAPTSEQNNLGESTPREDSPDHTRWWKVYVDGASNSKGSGTGSVLAGLKSAKTLGARRLIVYCDSLLVASQINGEYMARDERMVGLSVESSDGHDRFRNKKGSRNYQKENREVLVVKGLESSTDGPSRDPIFYAFTLTLSRICYTRYMKASVEVILGADLWHTELLPRDIGGPTCRKTQWTMSESAINVKDSHIRFINRPESCSHYSPAYPQSNGQAEGLEQNRNHLHGGSTGETPFSLAYGSEAVIPLEIGLPTLRTSEWEPTRNDLAQSQALDLLEERREQAMIRLASYQQQLKKGYNKNIRPRSFQQGDLVLRKVLGNTKKPDRR
uniref:RNase H type-1 domain-containing protein n=1 Tax=Fagus sylvatica TaxID=28930 RepID=A0A2N9EPU0_FAGSY